MSPSIEEFEHLMASQFLKMRIELAITVLLVYEYLILLSHEVHLMWRAKFRFSSMLYFCVRYPLFARMVMLVFIPKNLPQVLGPSQLKCCTPLLQFTDALTVLTRAAVTTVLVLRTHAIYDQNRFILVVLMFLSLCIISINVFQLVIDRCGVVNPTHASVLGNIINSAL
ncbi:hypothetical protein K439DRAFT_1664741, partial [Ramaria rubella]